MTRHELIEECERLCRAGQLEAAATRYHNYLVANPHDAAAFRAFASIRTRQGKHAWAAALLRRAEILDGSEQCPDPQATQRPNSPVDEHIDLRERDGDTADEVVFFEAVEREETALRVEYDGFDDQDASPAGFPAGTTDEQPDSSTAPAAMSTDTKEHPGSHDSAQHRPWRTLSLRQAPGRRSCHSSTKEAIHYRNRRRISSQTPRDTAGNESLLEGDTSELEPAQRHSAPTVRGGDVASPPIDGSEASVAPDEVASYKDSPQGVQRTEAPQIQHELDFDREGDEDAEEELFEELIAPDTDAWDEASEEEDFDWLDLVSHGFADEEETDEEEPQNLTELFGVDTGGQRLAEWEKAKLMAYDVAVACRDTSRQLVSVLYQIFRLSPYPATRTSISRAIEAGANADDLAAAAEVRAIWQNHPEFANCFRQGWDSLGEAWGKTEQARRMLSWPAALAVVRAFRSYPCHEEIECWLEDLFEQWWNCDERRWRFQEFRLYVGYRTGAMPGCLDEWPEWSFDADPAMTDPFLSEDDPGERYLWSKTKRELNIPECLSARPPVPFRRKRRREEADPCTLDEAQESEQCVE